MVRSRGLGGISLLRLLAELHRELVLESHII